MAIIYTYPTKTTLADSDLILISDSEDGNKTRNATVTSIKDAIDVVDSLTATLPLLSSSATGSPDLSISGISGYGTAGQVMRMNTGATALEWATVSGGSGDGLIVYNDGSGIGLNITKLDFIGYGVSATLDGGDNTRAKITIDGGPQGNDNNVQLKNGTGFTGSDDLDFDSNVLSVKHTLDIKGQGNLLPAGRLKLYCENSSHGVTLEGPLHAGNNSYTLKFPSAAPNNNQILQYTTAGNLGWIATPSGGTDTNIANSQLQLENNRTLDFYDGSTSVRSLSFIRTNGGSKNMFKFEADGGTSPTFTVGNADSTYEGYIVIEGNGSSRTGQVQFKDADGDYYTGIKAATTQTANTTYTLPAAQGAAGEFLKNDGTGILSWDQGASYTEGTWIPSLTFGGGQTTPTLSQASGNYVIIGKYVYANFYVVTQAGTQYTGTLPRISIPVAAAGNGGHLMMNTAYTTTSTNTSVILGSVVGGMSIVGLKTMDQQGGEVRIQNLGASPSTSYNNAVLAGSIIYLKS